jgi:hypothetical protein
VALLIHSMMEESSTPTTPAKGEGIAFVTSPEGVRFPPTPTNLRREFTSEESFLKVQQEQLTEKQERFERQLFKHEQRQWELEQLHEQRELEYQQSAQKIRDQQT